MTLYIFLSCLSVFLVLVPELLTLGLLASRKTESKSSSHDYESTHPHEQSLDVVVPIKVPEDEAFASFWLTRFSEVFPNPQVKLIIASNGTWEDKVASRNPAISISHSDDGASKASNIEKALSESNGDFVAVFDADSLPTAPVELGNVARILEKADCVQGANIVSVSEAGFVGELCAYGSLLSACTSEVFAVGERKTSQFRGSNGYFRREILEATGFKVDTSLEDIDVTIRLLLEGRTIAFDPQLVAREAPPKDLAQVIRQRARWNLGWGDLARKHIVVALKSDKLPTYQKLRVAGYLAWIALVLPGSIFVLLLSQHVLVSVALILCAKFVAFEILLRFYESTEKMRRVFVASSNVVTASMSRRLLWSVCFSCLEFLKCLAVIGVLFGTSSRWPVTRKNSEVFGCKE